MTELINGLLAAKSYSQLCVYVGEHYDELESMHTELGYNEEITSLRYTPTKMDNSLESQWGNYQTMSKDVSELLEACTDYYVLARKLSMLPKEVYNKYVKETL